MVKLIYTFQNEIDSFLLDREHIAGSTVSSIAATDDAKSSREGFPYISHGGEKESPREGWPYPNYGGGARVESTTNFRTWARGGT